MSVLSNLLYMLTLLGVGLAGRASGALTPPRTSYLTRFAFVIALPALIFTSTATQPLESVLSPALVVAIPAILAGLVLLSLAAHRHTPGADARSVAVVQSYHGNLGFLGVPIVATTFGGLATAKASLILGIAALIQIPLTIAILVTMNGSDRSIARELTTLATNPILGALGLGLVFSVTGLPVPGVVATPLGLVADLALPIALLAVGASLSPEFGGFHTTTVARTTLLKTAVMPLLAFGVFTALDVPQTTLQAGVVMMAMPAAVSTFVYATELGGNEDLASVTVFVSTIVSLILVFATLPLLG